MILHHIPFSRSFRVLWMLEELGLEAEIKTYAITDGSLRSPAYKALNPMARVPCLEWNGRAVSESGAILQLLAEDQSDAGFDRPAGHPERAAYLEAFGFAETMGSQIEALNMQHLFLHDPTTRSVTVMKLNTLRLRAALQVLDQRLSRQDHVAGADVSAADMMLGFNLLAAPYYVPLAAFAHLQAYLARITARPAYQRALAKDGPQTFYSQEFYPLPESG